MYFLTSDVLLRPWFFINVMKSFSPLLTRKETSATVVVQIGHAVAQDSVDVGCHLLEDLVEHRQLSLALGALTGVT